MNNEEILEKVMHGEKTLVAFYPYPSGAQGDPIAETDNHNGRKHDLQLKTFVSLMLHLGASVAGTRMDNKVGVEVNVRGLDFPVFLCFKDGRYTVSREIRQRDGREPDKINWRVDY